MKIGLALAVIALAAPAMAQVANEAQAKARLFSTRGHVVQVSGKLSKADQSIVRQLVPLMAKQLRQPVRYYAAIAYSPDDGLVHEALQAAMNYHTPQAADRAAVAACNALKSQSAQSCRVAARVVPKGYEPRALTLSIDATAGFNSAYRKAKPPKSFAISRKTGDWAMGKSDSAAIAGCEKQGRPGDCEIVIRD